jgi:hypothetical protein
LCREIIFFGLLLIHGDSAFLAIKVAATALAAPSVFPIASADSSQIQWFGAVREGIPFIRDTVISSISYQSRILYILKS